jgi:hypothetical protein
VEDNNKKLYKEESVLNSKVASYCASTLSTRGQVLHSIPPNLKEQIREKFHCIWSYIHPQLNVNLINAIALEEFGDIPARDECRKSKESGSERLGSKVSKMSDGERSGLTFHKGSAVLKLYHWLTKLFQEQQRGYLHVQLDQKEDEVRKLKSQQVQQLDGGK